MGVARNVIKDAKLVPGGGASEMAVAAILKKKSMSIEGVEQVGIFGREVANSLVLQWNGLEDRGQHLTDSRM